MRLSEPDAYLLYLIYLLYPSYPLYLNSRRYCVKFELAVEPVGIAGLDEADMAIVVPPTWFVNSPMAVKSATPFTTETAVVPDMEQPDVGSEQLISTAPEKLETRFP